MCPAAARFLSLTHYYYYKYLFIVSLLLGNVFYQRSTLQWNFIENSAAAAAAAGGFILAFLYLLHCLPLTH